METKTKLRAGLCLSLLLVFRGLPGAEAPQSAPRQQVLVVGLSPYLPTAVKDEVYRGLVRLLVEDLPLNSTTFVYDAFNLRSITRIDLPNARAFCSPKTRANQFAPAIRELKQFLAQEHIKPMQPRLHFEAALRLPQFCDFLAENLGATNGELTILLAGSPLYQDAKEPGFSMVDGYFPSDGHLQALREESIFGFSGEKALPPSLIVHWVYFGDPWVSDLYKEKVTRFWALYLQRRGGQLATLSGDLPTVLHAFCSGAGGNGFAQQGWAVDVRQTKLEMLRVTRNVGIADWLTGEPIAGTAHQAPATMVGPMKIGIRWQDNIDLDLYATPHPGAETLFFQHPRTSEGYYYKDHRSSPGREYEFIEFETPVDAREVEAAVNFYKGTCPGGPRGDVRIEFDGRIYAAPFAIVSPEGNRGRTGSRQRDCWTRIPIQQILKIARGSE